MPPSNQPKVATFGRSQFSTATGRRCRSLITNPDGRFCLRHTWTQSVNGDFVLALTDRALDFRSQRGIHNSLQQLYMILSAGQISPRRAATLAYIGNLLIKHLPAAQQRDPAACYCIGVPHLRHELYPAPTVAPAPAKQVQAMPAPAPSPRNSVAETNSSPHDPRDKHTNTTPRPALLSTSQPSKSAKQPDSANLN